MEPKYKLRKVLISREGLLDWPRLRRQLGMGMGMGMPLAMTESAKSKQGFGKPASFQTRLSWGNKFGVAAGGLCHVTGRMHSVTSSRGFGRSGTLLTGSEKVKPALEADLQLEARS